MNTSINLSRKHIVHVAGIRLTRETGMGRIACEWRDAFVRRGYRFSHVGLDEVPIATHITLWQRQARAWIARQGWNLNDPLWLVHEAGGGVFTSANRRTCIFSHGIERRGRELAKPPHGNLRQTLKSFLTRPLWLRYNRDTDCGLRRAWRVIVSNSEDAQYAREVYGRSSGNVWIFKNGVDLVDSPAANFRTTRPKILFVATWFPRKGIDLIMQAAESLYLSGQRPQWVLAGVGVTTSKVIESFPSQLRDDITVIQKFLRADESSLFADADIFVLPTFFEGQSLALLQAMAHGLCCITTDCCGQKDIIKHGINGLLFPSGDIKAFVGCLHSALSDLEKRKTLGRAAAASVADREWTRVGDELVDWFEQEIGSDGRNFFPR